MKTKKEIKDWLLENAVDEDGDLDLMYLDFSNFEGSVYTSYMKVKNNLFQDRQKVKGGLWQSHQEVQGCLWQNYQKVRDDLDQSYQEVQGNFITQTLTDDEVYKIDKYINNCIVKKENK